VDNPVDNPVEKNLPTGFLKVIHKISTRYSQLIHNLFTDLSQVE